MWLIARKMVVILFVQRFSASCDRFAHKALTESKLTKLAVTKFAVPLNQNDFAMSNCPQIGGITNLELLFVWGSHLHVAIDASGTRVTQAGSFLFPLGWPSNHEHNKHLFTLPTVPRPGQRHKAFEVERMSDGLEILERCR